MPKPADQARNTAILALKASGLTNTQIASTLSLTPGTVSGILLRARKDVFPLCITVDDDMIERIERFRGKISRSQAVRELIEWGLEAAEKEWGAEAPRVAQASKRP